MRTITPYPLRISDELRAKLQIEADAMGRSLNAEIAIRLERSLTGDGISGPRSEHARYLRNLADWMEVQP